MFGLDLPFDNPADCTHSAAREWNNAEYLQVNDIECLLIEFVGRHIGVGEIE